MYLIHVFEDEQIKKTIETQIKTFEQKDDSETISTPIIEKTTFGDIEELAALKEKLENQKASAKRNTEKAKAKDQKTEETIEEEKKEVLKTEEIEVSEVKDKENETKQTEAETKAEVEAKTEAGETEATTEVKENQILKLLMLKPVPTR